MKRLNSDEIFGNWATLLLPLNSDDSIDYLALSEEIDTMISMKVNGIYSNGTAGEFYNQTEDEFNRINQLLADKCTASGMPFQVGCSHMSPKISLERLQRSIAWKPGAIQVILPDWFPPSMKEIIDFLRVMEEKAEGIGLVLYNPPHAKKRLTPADFSEIKNAGISLVGSKLPGGDTGWYAAMKEAVPGMSVFVPGHHLATGIGLGAKGAYSNVACLHPGVAQEWYECMLTDMEKALELESRIRIFMQDHIVPFIREKNYSNQAVDKLMTAVGGWTTMSTRLRWPYQWIEEEEVTRLRSIYSAILPEFSRGYLLN
ncbi:MAG: dihydrodipicolinate synthase family protein [Bacteroidota bacterium]